MESQLENLESALNENYPKFVTGSHQEAAEITNQRRTLEDKEKRDELTRLDFWTANFAMYAIEDNEVYVYLGGRGANPIFNDNNIEDATNQLGANQHYRPDQASIEDVKQSIKLGNTIRVKLSDLELKEDKSKAERGFYFAINTRTYDRLNKSQRKVAEIPFGKDTFEDNMWWLSKCNFGQMRIYLVDEKHVRSTIQEGEAMVLACGLNQFLCGGYFRADLANVNEKAYMRGIKKTG